jgi:hypothetical protein
MNEIACKLVLCSLLHIIIQKVQPTNFTPPSCFRKNALLQLVFRPLSISKPTSSSLAISFRHFTLGEKKSQTSSPVDNNRPVSIRIYLWNHRLYQLHEEGFQYIRCDPEPFRIIYGLNCWADRRSRAFDTGDQRRDGLGSSRVDDGEQRRDSESRG